VQLLSADSNALRHRRLNHNAYHNHHRDNSGIASQLQPAVAGIDAGGRVLPAWLEEAARLANHASAGSERHRSGRIYRLRRWIIIVVNDTCDIDNYRYCHIGNGSESIAKHRNSRTHGAITHIGSRAMPFR
jgi:hypothetical protein